VCGFVNCFRVADFYALMPLSLRYVCFWPPIVLLEVTWDEGGGSMTPVFSFLDILLSVIVINGLVDSVLSRICNWQGGRISDVVTHGSRVGKIRLSETYGRHGVYISDLLSR